MFLHSTQHAYFSFTHFASSTLHDVISVRACMGNHFSQLGQNLCFIKGHGPGTEDVVKIMYMPSCET